VTELALLQGETEKIPPEKQKEKDRAFWNHIHHYPQLEKAFTQAHCNWERLEDGQKQMVRGIEKIAHGHLKPGRVAVLGSGLHQHPNRRKLCEILGYFLGESGHILIHGSADVGRAVAQAFSVLNTRKSCLLNYRVTGKEFFPFGTTVEFADIHTLRSALTKDADFFIVVGGGKGTKREMKLATSLGKEVCTFTDDFLELYQSSDVLRGQHQQPSRTQVIPIGSASTIWMGNVMKAEQGIVGWKLDGIEHNDSVFEIEFQSEFKEKPLVHAGFTVLDVVSSDMTARYDIRVNVIDTKRAEIHVKTWHVNKLWAYQVSWLALGE
jgi:hypothetical protein